MDCCRHSEAKPPVLREAEVRDIAVEWACHPESCPELVSESTLIIRIPDNVRNDGSGKRDYGPGPE